MDTIDRSIIALIQKDGQLSYEKLGKAVGLSISAVNDRLKKLQKEGVITGWQACICPAKAGFEVLAFVQVLVDEQKHKATFSKMICQIEEVQECHHITGEWSYLLKIRARSIAHLEILINEKIRQIAGVMRTHTLIALSTLLEKKFFTYKGLIL